MSLPIIIGGETFELPTRRERGWSDELNAIIVALNGAIEDAGGLTDQQLALLTSTGTYALEGGGTLQDIIDAVDAASDAGLFHVHLGDGTWVADAEGRDDDLGLLTVPDGFRITGNGRGRTFINIINTTQGDGEGGVAVFRLAVDACNVRVNGIHWLGDNGDRDGTGFVEAFNNENECISVPWTGTSRDCDFSDNTFECLWGMSIHDRQGTAYDSGGNARITARANTYRYCANGVNINASFCDLDGDFEWSEGYECSGAFNQIRGRFKHALGVACTVGGNQDPGASFPGNQIWVTVDGGTGAGVTVTDSAHGTFVVAYVRNCEDAGLIVNGSVNPPQGVIVMGEFDSNCKDPGANLNGIYLASGDGHQLIGVRSFDSGVSGFAQKYGLNVAYATNVRLWGGYFSGVNHDVSVGTGATGFRYAGTTFQNNSIEFISTSSTSAEMVSGKDPTDIVWAARSNATSGLPERSAIAIQADGTILGGNGIDLHDISLARTGVGEWTIDGDLIITGSLTGGGSGVGFDDSEGDPVVASVAADGTSSNAARRDHVHPAQTSVSGNAGTATALQGGGADRIKLDGIEAGATDDTADISALYSAISSEASTRSSADSTLSSAISSEASARASADSAIVAGNVATATALQGGGADRIKLDSITSGATAGVTSVGSVGAGTADALAISGTVLTAHAATATQPGIIKAGDQQLVTGVKAVEALELLNNTPSAPGSGKLRWFNKLKAKPLAHILNPSGAPSAVQSMLAFKRIDYQCAVGAGNTTFTGFGTSSTSGNLNMTTFGTLTAASLATTNILTASRRVLVSTGTGAGTAGGVRCGTLKWWNGNAAGLGGYYFTTRFGFSAITLATSRWFVGLRGTTGAVSGGTEPSAQTNSLIVGQDLADSAAMYFMWADGSSTNNRQTTGITPAINKVYELCIYVPPNGSTVDFYIEECNTSTNYSYQATSNLPTTFLGEYYYIHNGSTGADYSIAYLYHYGESDYG